MGSGGRRDGGDDPEATDVTLLSELDAADFEALCDEIGELFEDGDLSPAELNAVSCTYGALFNIDIAVDDSTDALVANGAQCQAHVADCVTLSAGARRLSCENDAFAAASTTCNVPVEDYRACMEVGIAAFVDAVDVVTCENLSNPNESEQAFESAIALDLFIHDECALIATRCPMLFGGSPSGPPAVDGCDETCRYSDDGFCDDGGFVAQTGLCALGTDCLDCGSR